MDSSKGTYETFGGVVRSFGGWEWCPAVMGAKQHCLKSAAMGGDWCYVDGMSGLTFFFLLKKEWEGEFTAKWKQFEQQLSSPTAQSAVADASAVSSAPSSAPVPAILEAAPEAKQTKAQAAEAKRKAREVAAGSADEGKTPKGNKLKVGGEGKIGEQSPE